MIDVRDLEFCYPGSPAPTVRGLNFEVTRGEIFGFLGPSGAGKSTTQKVLIGLLKWSPGTKQTNTAKNPANVCQQRQNGNMPHALEPIRNITGATNSMLPNLIFVTANVV